MAHNEAYRTFSEAIREAPPTMRELTVPVYAPERSHFQGKMASESRDFFAMLGVGIFSFLVPFVVGMVSSRDWLLLLSAFTGLAAPLIFRAVVAHERINAVMIATFSAPEPDTPPPAFLQDPLQGRHSWRENESLLPPGWTFDQLHEFARESVARYATYDEAGLIIGFDITYGSRAADDETRGRLKNFRAWAERRGYGREQGERQPWIWYEKGIDHMQMWAVGDWRF